MSVFDDDDNDDVKESIRFFNRLTDADKVRVLSDLNPFIFQQKQETSRYSLFYQSSNKTYPSTTQSRSGKN